MEHNANRYINEREKICWNLDFFQKIGEFLSQWKAVIDQHMFFLTLFYLFCNNLWNKKNVKGLVKNNTVRIINFNMSDIFAMFFIAIYNGNFVYSSQWLYTNMSNVNWE